MRADSNEYIFLLTHQQESLSIWVSDRMKLEVTALRRIC